MSESSTRGRGDLTLRGVLVGEEKISRSAVVGYFAAGFALLAIGSPSALTKSSPLASIWGLGWVWRLLDPLGVFLGNLFSSSVLSYFNGAAALAAIWILPLFVVASSIRALWLRSFEPLGTAIVPMGAGLVALPAFSWVVVILGWVVRVAIRVAFWVLQIAAVAIGYVVTHPWVPILLAVLVVVALVVGSLVAHKLGLLLGGLAGLVIAGLPFYGIGLLANWMNSKWHLQDASESAEKFAQNLIGTVLVLAVVVFVVAYLGQSLIQPFQQASNAGSVSSAHADIAAGMGVSLAILLLACQINPGFQSWFISHLQGSFVGGLWMPVASAPRWLLGSGVLDFLAPCLKGFNGFPEFAVIGGSGLIAAARLLVAGRKRTMDSWGTLMKATILRTMVAIVVALLIGWLLGRVQSDN